MPENNDVPRGLHDNLLKAYAHLLKQHQVLQKSSKILLKEYNTTKKKCTDLKYALSALNIARTSEYKAYIIELNELKALKDHAIKAEADTYTDYKHAVIKAEEYAAKCYSLRRRNHNLVIWNRVLFFAGFITGLTAVGVGLLLL